MKHSPSTRGAADPRSAPLAPGIWSLHKPVGPTSHDLVRAQLHPGLKLCHGGTLDPFADGLLLLLVGPTTRLFPLLHELPKVYEATVVWGTETDNGDLGGQVVARGDASTLRPEALQAALAPLLGWTDQVPPATSAKKVGGEPAYRKVHRGEEVTLPACAVYLHEAAWLRHDLPHTSRLRLVCRGGFYVRSLVRDLGRAIGVPAHVSALTRAAIGPWSDPGPGRATHAHGPALLPWCPRVELTPEEHTRIKAGHDLPPRSALPPLWQLPAGFPPPSPRVVALWKGRATAVLEERDGAWHPGVNLRGGA